MLKNLTCKAQVTISGQPQIITNHTPIYEAVLWSETSRWQSLSAYSVQSGSTIHALKKTVSEDQLQVKDPLDSVSIQQEVTG